MSVFDRIARATRGTPGQRVVVVTGASGGIGRAIAREFAGGGDRVALLARGESGLDGAARDVRESGGTPLALEVDTADHQQVDEAASRIERELGVIDVWVNNAFTTVFAPITSTRPDEFRRVAEVTYLGYVHGTLAALHRMRPRDRGTIVQVGSALACRGLPLQAGYSAAKHAIQGFHDALRSELLHDRSAVRTTMVQLPAVNTPQFGWVRSRLPRHAQPVPPIYQPEIAARAVAYAADHPARKEYWVGGSTVGTLLAEKFASPLLDRHLARSGYAAQQTVQSRRPDQPENLWDPADDRGEPDPGAHGVFDARARPHSTQLWAAQHRRVLAGTVAGTVAVAARLARWSSRAR